MAGQKDSAKAWLLQHPDASIAACVAATLISFRTVAQARTELAKAGLLKRGRRGVASAPAGAPPVPALPSPPGATASVPDREGEREDRLLSDDEVMEAASDDGFLSDLDLLDDEETRKRLLREVKRLAFSPTTHADTKLSATQVWLKLKDMAKARDLGPGRPLTREDAKARLQNLFTAINDLTLVVEALMSAFQARDIVNALYGLLGLSEPSNERQIPAVSPEAAPSPSGTSPAPGGDPPLQADDSPAGPQ